MATAVEMVDVTRPNRVSVDGRNLNARSSAGQHWSYQAATSTLRVDIGSRPVEQTTKVVAVGAMSTDRDGPAVASSPSS